MQMTLILNTFEKLALMLGLIGVVGFAVCLINAIAMSIKSKSMEPLSHVFFTAALVFELHVYFNWISIFA